MFVIYCKYAFKSEKVTDVVKKGLTSVVQNLKSTEGIKKVVWKSIIKSVHSEARLQCTRSYASYNVFKVSKLIL